MSISSKIGGFLFQLIRRTLILAFFGFVVLFTSLVFGLQIPAVQHKIVSYSTETLTKALGYPIELQGISITWTAGLQLKGVVIRDRRNQDMIKVETLTAKFSLVSLLGRDIIVRKVWLSNSDVRLKYYKDIDDVNISDFIYSIQHMGQDSADRSKPSAPHVGRYTNFIIKEIEFENGKFSYIDTDENHVNDRFDFTNMALDSINIKASKFKIVADTVSLKVSGLACRDIRSGLKVKNFDSDFGICENYLKLENTKGYIGKSKIDADIEFRFNSFRQLSYIQDSVDFKIKVSPTSLATNDLKVFFPELTGLNDVWQINGKISGPFYDLKLNGLDVAFGNNSYGKGSASFKGLPDMDKLIMNINLSESHIEAFDIKNYGLKENYDNIKSFGFWDFKGEFTGNMNDFVIKGDAATALGKINTDLNFSYKSENILQTAVYKGVLGLENFDFKSFNSPDWLKKISLNFKIDGRGFDPQTADFHASGFINKINLDSYDYKNAFVNLKYAKKRGQATIDVKDSALVLEAIVKTDIQEKHFSCDAKLHKLDAYKIGLYPKPLAIASDIRYSSTGYSLQDLNFSLSCKDNQFNSALKTVRFDKFSISYVKLDSISHILSLRSALVDANVEGKFDLFQLKPVLDTLTTKASENFNGKKKLVNSTDFIQNHEKIAVDFDVKFNTINPVLNIFFPEYRVSDGSILKGRVVSGQKISISSKFKSDTVQIGTQIFAGVAATTEIKKDSEESPLFAKATFEASQHFVNNTPSLEKIIVSALWEKDTIRFSAYTKQQNEINEASLEGFYKVGTEDKVLKFSKAELKLLDNTWNIDQRNKIVVKPQYLGFEFVELKSDSQIISLQGNLSQIINNKFSLLVKNFRLQNLDKFTGTKLEGKLDGFLDIQDYYSEIKINSNITAKALKINKLLVGNITGYSKWDNVNSKIDLNLDIERFKTKMFSLHGNYMPNSSSGSEKLNIVAILNKTDIAVFEPFTKDIISELKGNATGLITIRGSLGNPLITGEIEVDEGSLKVNYLNTTYYFNDKLVLNPDGLELNNVLFSDNHGGLAVLNGGIYHSKLNDLKIKIQGEFKNATLLDTDIKDNNIFYGVAVGSGEFSLDGGIDYLDIKLKGSVQKGTKMYIIYNSNSGTEEQSFIKFNITKPIKGVQSTDNATNKQSNESENDFRITTKLEIDITPDAYCEFILDKNTGDKIAGYGQGPIRLEYDSEGDFHMYGDYTFAKDSYYLFTFLNVINKKFTIKPGSHVEWNGNPSEGILDVSARYEDRISLHPLVDSIHWNKAGIRTPYPVATVLNLNGEMLKPDITYDIVIYNYPSVISGVPMFNYISAFENKIHNNTNEMNTQVFSLLVFRRFLYGSSGLEGAAGSTVSELLTNQLSQIVSQLDKNLQVDLRMNGLAALNSMQVRISYEFLDGKIRVTRSGGVTNTQSHATTASIIGDISVEYMLTNDGKFRLKGFTRQNPNTLSISSGSQGNSSTGASIMHTTNFESLNPFSGKKKKKATKTPDVDTTKSK